MEKRKVRLFIIIGILLLVLDLLDISGGFLAIATSRSIPRVILFLATLTILCCAVALTLSFKQRLIVYGSLSIGFCATTVFGVIMNETASYLYDGIPVKESVPFLLEGLKLYHLSFGPILVLHHIAVIMLAMVYFIGVMSITLAIKYGYQKIGHCNRK